MTDYNILGTKKTPNIEFNPELGELKIWGRSLPENGMGFYKELFEKIDEYIENPKATTIIDFNFDYLNSISTKIILRLIIKFERLINIGLKVNIIWNYEDDDEMMCEIGESIKATSNIPTQMIEANAA